MPRPKSSKRIQEETFGRFWEDEVKTTGRGETAGAPKRTRLDEAGIKLEIAERMLFDQVCQWNDAQIEVSAHMIMTEFHNVYAGIHGEEPKFWGNNDSRSEENWLQRFLHAYGVKRLRSERVVDECKAQAKIHAWLGTHNYLRNMKNPLLVNADEIPVYESMKTGTTYTCPGHSSVTKVRFRTLLG